MDKLIVTITCDSTMSYPRNPYNPKGVEALAEEYIRCVNAGAAICHLHGPYTLDEKIQADGTKLSDLDLPGWQRLRDLIEAKVSPIIQYGIANGKFPQRVELMKQSPDMMSICFNAHDECFQPDPNYPPVELYGIHDREELEKYCRFTKANSHKPEDFNYSVSVMDPPTQWQVLTQSILLGGHVRVGMEDNPYLDTNGTLARSNAELVDKIIQIARALGRDIASADEARQITGLKSKPVPVAA